MDLTLILIVIAIPLIFALIKGIAAGTNTGEESDLASNTVPQARRHPKRDVVKLVAPLLLPANLIRTTNEPSTSFLGGVPQQTPGFIWPRRNDKRLTFLACIDLSLPEKKAEWLPASGLLLFFYDVAEQPWGMSLEDRAGWSVIYVEAPSPDERPVSEAAKTNDAGLARLNIRFETVDQPPLAGEHAAADLELTDEEAAELHDLRSAQFAELPEHQLGGYPTSLQSDLMPVECELIFSGGSSDSSMEDVERRMDELTMNGTDWRLLLQVDTDEDLGVMWGDAGMLYFWIRESDARRGDFSNVWLILQCC